MNQKLFTVNDRFYIKIRGTILTGEFEPDSPTFKIGNVVMLIYPTEMK